jgi:hypothetical protein
MKSPTASKPEASRVIGSDALCVGRVVGQCGPSRVGSSAIAAAAMECIASLVHVVWRQAMEARPVPIT